MVQLHNSAQHIVQQLSEHSNTKWLEQQVNNVVRSCDSMEWMDVYVYGQK